MHAAGRVDLEEFLVQEAIRQSLAAQAPPAGEGEGAAMQSSEPAAEADAAARMLGGLDIAASSDQHGGSEGEEVAGSAPLVLDDSELDAIANVTSRPRPSAAASDTITSPVLTAVATAASPDDLMSFAGVDADALVAPQSPSSPPLPPPPGRPRRRPPPPPPPPPPLSATHSKQEQQQQQSRHGAAEEPSQPQPPLIHL
ncbi:hypothetical protein GGF42_008984 [Coemansia sp. RSA 2424]|nr:hypothetical protein GGF42_008984 [Coemansia sp. RSA 2424]